MTNPVSSVTLFNKNFLWPVHIVWYKSQDRGKLSPLSDMAGKYYICGRFLEETSWLGCLKMYAFGIGYVLH